MPMLPKGSEYYRLVKQSKKSKNKVQQCIECTNNENGWCSKYKKWCSIARDFC